MKLRRLKPGERVNLRWFSIHIREERDSLNTLWIYMAMPWKRLIYNFNCDEMEMQHPVYCFGFKFTRGGRP